MITEATTWMTMRPMVKNVKMMGRCSRRIIMYGSEIQLLKKMLSIPISK